MGIQGDASMSYTLDDTPLSLFSDVCSHCRHFDAESVKRACRAFPGGIPVSIWEGRNDHTRPVPGDNGIQFEPVEDE